MDVSLTHDPSTWQAVLQEITLERRGEVVTIDIIDDELGDQVPAHGLPLDSIAHDVRDDVLIIALRGMSPDADVVLRHMVRGPRSVDLLEQAHGCLVLRVVDAAGTKTLVAFAPDHTAARTTPR